VSALVFSLRGEPPERLDLSPLTPLALGGLGRRDIEVTRLGQSKRASTVGDIFRVTGSEAGEIVFEGGSRRFDRVASGMVDGMVRVIGDVGAQAGRGMAGGHLVVDGEAGPHAGSGMRGGRLEIHGDAGECLGGPLAGETAGMSGGVLVVRGMAGDFAADRMRRGLIAVLGGAGRHAGCRMIAGTLVIVGGTGEMPGYLMRRGSILLDRMPESLSPSFVENGAPDSVFARLVDRHLVADGILARPLLGASPRRYGGDNAVLGKGELLVPA